MSSCSASAFCAISNKAGEGRVQLEILQMMHEADLSCSGSHSSSGSEGLSGGKK